MALNLTELSGYLTSLGPLPATSSCGSYPVCSIEMIGRGVQTGRLHRDHLLTMVHPVDECYNMLARICTCGSPCWDTRATSVEATVQLNNTILLNFTGPILPLVPYTNGSHVGMLTVALNNMTLHGPDFASIDVSNWPGNWTNTDSDRAELALAADGQTAIMDLRSQRRASGSEVVSLQLLPYRFIGPLGMIVSVNFSIPLFDRIAPTFTAELASSSLANRIVAINNDWGEMSFLVSFSEPCYGSGPGGSFVDHDWRVVIQEQEFSLEDFNITATISVKVWPVGRRKLTDYADFQHSTVGVTQLGLILGLSVTGPLQTESGIVPTVALFFVGPADKAITDADGNYIRNDLYPQPVMLTVPIDIQTCTGSLRRCRDFRCSCAHVSPPPPPFAHMPPPPPSPLPPPPSSPPFPPSSPPPPPDSTAAVIGAAMGSLVLLLLMLLIFLWCRRRGRRNKKDELKEQVGKLQELERQLLKLDTSDAEDEMIKLLNDAMIRSDQKNLSLEEAVKEIIDGHNWVIAAGGDLCMQIVELAMQNLTAAFGAAASDREALEILDSVLQDARTSELIESWEGGGGVRLRPPKLVAPGESCQYVLRAVINEDDLPENILAFAAAMSFDDDLQNELDEVANTIRSSLVLPGTIAAALMAEYASLNPDSPSATEHEQVALLAMMLLGRVLHNSPVDQSGGGARIRPPALKPPGWASGGEVTEKQLPLASLIPVDIVPSGMVPSDLVPAGVVQAYEEMDRCDAFPLRVVPPKLLPFDPRQDGEYIGRKDLAELAKISLDSHVTPLREGDLSGGVKVRPPMLKPVDIHNSKKPIDATNETAELCGGWKGGGGVCVHPPKLLSAIRASAFGANHEAEPTFARMRVVRAIAGWQRPSHESLDEVLHVSELQRAKSMRDLRDVAAETVNSVLGAGDQGGGVRLPPPKLKVVPQADAFSAIAEDAGRGEAWKARVQPPTTQPEFELTHNDVLSSKHCDMFLDALIESASAAPKHANSEAQRDAIHLQKVDDSSEAPAPEVLAASVERCIADETLKEGFAAGGGVRLPPPKLKPVGGWTAAAQAEEAQFLQAMGANVSIIAEAVNMAGLAVKDDQERSVQLAEREAHVLEEILQSTLHSLEEDILITGHEAGGGVRLPPPKLVPIGIESKMAKMEADEFMDQWTFTRPKVAAPVPLGRQQSYGSPTKVADASATMQTEEAPPSLLMMKRKSTQEMFTMRTTPGDSPPLRQAPVRLQRISSVVQTAADLQRTGPISEARQKLLDELAALEKLEKPNYGAQSPGSLQPESPKPRRPRPQRPDGPPGAKILMSTDVVEGWDGGGGVRIVPGLLKLAQGAPPKRGNAPEPAEAEGAGPPTPPPSPPAAYGRRQLSFIGKVHHAANLMPDLSHPTILWVDADSDDDAAYDVEHNIPLRVLRTLIAQDRRERGRSDGVQLAKELVLKYARAHGKIPVDSTSIAGDDMSKPTSRNRVVTEALIDAVQTIKTTKVMQGAEGGTDALQRALPHAIAELEAEIDSIDDDLCPCCSKKRGSRVQPEWGPFSKKQRTRAKVAPSPAPIDAISSAQGPSRSRIEPGSRSRTEPGSRSRTEPGSRSRIEAPESPTQTPTSGARTVQWQPAAVTPTCSAKWQPPTSVCCTAPTLAAQGSMMNADGIPRRRLAPQMGITPPPPPPRF